MQENCYPKRIKLENKKQHKTNNNLWNYLNIFIKNGSLRKFR